MGILEKLNFPNRYICDEPYTGSLDSEKLVRDWRVAGAVMERLPQGVSVGGRSELDGIWTAFVYGRSSDVIQNESLPRAIIETGVKALNCGR